MAGGEGLGEQYRGAGVHGEVSVQLRGVHLGQCPVGTGLGLVAHEAAQGTEFFRRGVDHARGSIRACEVGVHADNPRTVDSVLADPGEHVLDLIGTPRLDGIVWGEVMAEDGGAIRRDTARGGVADPGAAAHPRNDDGASTERKGLSGQRAVHVRRHPTDCRS